MKITDIKALEILDSRGVPTIKTRVFLEDGSIGIASVPSGASKGVHEDCELRDNDLKRYLGKGVLKAVDNVRGEIKNQVTEIDNIDQKLLDETMIKLDNTPNKSRLGANAILSVSLAFARAASNSLKKPLYRHIANLAGNTNPLTLPCPMMNIFNGGRHARNSSDIQEYMIIPSGAVNFSESLRCGVEIFKALKKILQAKGFITTVGDEGGFAIPLPSNEDPILYLLEAIKKAGYEAGKEVFLGIDAAASEFYHNGFYRLKEKKTFLKSDQLSDVYKDWISKYPIVSLEDAFEQDDWNAFRKFTEEMGTKIQVVGDDLFVTNVNRLKIGIDEKVGNAILIKLNQIGTLTETLNVMKLAKENGYKTIVSHRSGETEDDFIADLAVGTNSLQIKTGSLSRSERIAKYNRLLEIENELGTEAIFAKNNLGNQPGVN